MNFDIEVNRPTTDIADTMYGLFFEDINFGADGGIYAEMVKNRSFEFPEHLMGWRSFGNIEILDEGGPFDRNPHFIRLSSPGHMHKRTGIDNEGFFGVSFRSDSTYHFSVWARTASTGSPSKIKVELIDPAADGETQVCGSTTIDITSPDWTKYTASLKATETVEKGRLRIFLDSPFPVDLEHISLFPSDTWKRRDGGLRRDLVELLAGVNPGIFRFPGGCIVEGTDLNTRYQWKNTVGPVENRPLNENRWHYTFPHRHFPDYFQTGGLGFYEYFLLSEDLGAEPLPVLSVGLACQFQNNDPNAHVAVDSLDQYIQDAIDLVEFANGDPATPWGKIRASMGHPDPFGLKYIAIGNEQWGSEYVERLSRFIDEMRKKCPEIKIVGSSGPNSEGDQFDYLWPEMKRLKVDLVDEHFYRPEDWFLSQGMRYDNYDREGPKVFAGEYACHTKGYKRNNFRAALCEAAFMTGLERNADIVRMATYAPLVAHVEGWQWRPDMIWFDNFRSVPTASYYVQKLYGIYKGTRVIPLTMDGKPVAGLDGQNGVFATAAIDDKTNNYIIKVVNTSDTAHKAKSNLKGLDSDDITRNVRMITLRSNNATADNTLQNPDIIKPLESSFTITGDSFTTTLKPEEFVVYIIEK
ncbi:MAG: carbohydrate binding domain-containing protein [Lachnoclostridium sp.]|nr:carbohydrate binding domain-containing protein [Lachnoclostridium sp.]